MGALPLWPAQHNDTNTKTPPCVQDIPLGLEDLVHLSSHPSRNPPVSQQEHVSSLSPLKFPVEVISSCIVAFLVCWPMLAPDYQLLFQMDQPSFVATISVIHIIKLNLEQLCSSLETCCFWFGPKDGLMFLRAFFAFSFPLLPHLG